MRVNDIEWEAKDGFSYNWHIEDQRKSCSYSLIEGHLYRGFYKPYYKVINRRRCEGSFKWNSRSLNATTSNGEMVGGKTLGETIFDQPWNKAPCYMSKTVESAKAMETYVLFPQQNNYHILLSLAIRLGVCGYYGPFSCPKIEVFGFCFQLLYKVDRGGNIGENYRA